MGERIAEPFELLLLWRFGPTSKPPRGPRFTKLKKALQVLLKGARFLFFRLVGPAWKRLIRPSYLHCPHCGYDGFDFYEKPYFVATRSGLSYVPGEPPSHWFEGVQSCPRCDYEWDVSDSS